jgi:hypothetical protein
MGAEAGWYLDTVATERHAVPLNIKDWNRSGTTRFG